MATSTSPRRRNFRNDLAVGQKLGIGFGLVGLVAVLLVIVTFAAIGRLNAAKDVENLAIERVEAATRLQHRAALMRAEQLAYVASDGGTRAAFDAAASDFEVALDDLRSTASSPVELALVAKISTGYQTFLAIDQFVWQAVLLDNNVASRNLVLGAAALDFGFMAADADMFAEEAERLQASKRIAFSDTRDQTHIVVAALGVLALVLVAGASRDITRLIRDPLLDVQLAAVQAAGGDLEAEAPVRGTDETGTLAKAFNSMLRQLRIRESSLLKEQERGSIVRQIDTALELAETEDDVYAVVGRALDHIAPDRATELLLADNSKAHFTQAVVAGDKPDGPGCGVSSPYSCPAVRAATVMTFDDSNSMDACPHLFERSADACSATCAPVSFMGRAVGVLHSTGPSGEHINEDTGEALETLARSTGGRIGVIRTTARTQLHATTDALTGLFNRRTFESRVRVMHRNGEPFTLVMADLDHFKLLNDTYGHEAGDKALQTFSHVLQETVRDDDVVSRWGGEEFTIAFVNATAAETAKSLDRLRVELHGRIATSGCSPFTASFGYVEAGSCPTFESAIRLADGALYEAKAAGRDQALAAEAPGIGVAQTPAAYQNDIEPADEFDDHRTFNSAEAVQEQLL